jgi:hypothetical protein
VADKDIKLNPEDTLGQVSKIAATRAEAAVPGPVPPVGPVMSPIDTAMNAVATAAAEKAADSAKAIALRGTEHHTASIQAVQSMQTQEEQNVTEVEQVQTDVPKIYNT